MKTLIILFFLLLASWQINAQETNPNYPAVGKPMLHFELDDVLYYTKRKVSLSDFKGQWLILDFWNRYCGVCLDSQPKINLLQNKFSGKVQFLLVGYNGSQYTKKSDDKAIRALYERNKALHNLTLPIAYDSLLMHRFNIRPTPYLIVIDPEGMVKAITPHITEANLNDLMEGKQVDLKPAYHGGEVEKAKRELLEREAAKKNKTIK